MPKPAYRLADLVAGITDENRHPEFDWGPPVGREFGAEGCDNGAPIAEQVPGGQPSTPTRTSPWKAAPTARPSKTR